MLETKNISNIENEKITMWVEFVTAGHEGGLTYCYNIYT